ncbi:MAG: TonB-dependent receptor [Pseudomonadales bacterium]|nr:MAG: TonB-dependent receptor [Pseudomonadales bacterium]
MSPNLSKRIIVLLALASQSFTLVASEEDDLLSLYDEEDLITIATGTQKQVRFAPSVATVITTDDIVASGARMLSEVLESVPGIHVGDALLFDDDLISIRGIQTSNNPQVLVQIDGVEIRHLFTAARPAGFHLPLANVQRIEIIRGPGSAVHGADAFAGVINVITKTGADIGGVELGARYGAFNTQDVWLNAGNAIGAVDWAFSHEYSTTNGDHNRMVTSELPAAGQTWSGAFRSEYEIYNTQVKASVAGWTARLHNWRLQNGGNGPGGAQVPDQQGFVETDYYQFDLANKSQLAADVALDARVGFHRGETAIDNVLFPVGAHPIDNLGNPYGVAGGPAFRNFPDGVIGNPEGEAKVFDVDFAVLYTRFANHVLRFGAGYLKEDVDAGERKNFGPGVLDTGSNPGQTVPATPVDVSDTQFAFLQDVDREAYHVSIQDEIRLSNDLELTVGLRFDEFNDVGGAVNPRAALVWAADYNLTTKFLYGRAFRAPSFTELFSKNNPSQLGNPELQPETIDTYEAAVDYQFRPNWNIKANAFYYEIEDLIDFKLDLAQLGLVASNEKNQTGYGLELSSHWQASDSIALSANASVQKIEDKDSNEDIANVPTAQFFAGLNWQPASGYNVRDFQMDFEVHWISDRERVTGDPRRDLASYTLVNVAARKAIANSGLSVAASVKNLLDKDAAEPSEFGPLYVTSDYPIQGRAAFIELNYRLR